MFSFVIEIILSLCTKCGPITFHCVIKPQSLGYGVLNDFIHVWWIALPCSRRIQHQILKMDRGTPYPIYLASMESFSNFQSFTDCLYPNRTCPRLKQWLILISARYGSSTIIVQASVRVVKPSFIH